MSGEKRACANCGIDFVVRSEDIAFYKRFNIPTPTRCRECRLQRRMAFRNERALYKRKCGAPNHIEEIVSVFSPEKPDQVYDHSAWWGDGWDGAQYGRDVDFSRPFMAQVRELRKEVPDIAMLNINPVNSDYCNITEGNKNCYLVIGGDFNENCMYSGFIFNSRESCDTHWVSKSEFNYETVDCIQCSRLLYSRYCEGCYDSAFLFSCRNCHDCFGCVNLTNQAYHIFNQPYSRQEYSEKLKSFDLSSNKSVTELRDRFARESLKYPRRYARAVRTTNSVGDNLEGVKNCYYCFEVFGGAEDCSYIWLAYSAVKNCYDCDHFGMDSENSCDVSTIYPGNRIFFSQFVFSSHDVQYSYNCHNCSDIFGCVGLRNKKYCILNRQYSDEEYKKLVPKIIEHMNAMPYRDKGGKVYRYGEFFPMELSPFAYNETVAQEYFPLTREEAVKRGLSWREPDTKGYRVTLWPADVPDSIRGTQDSVLSEVIGCAHEGKCTEQCATAFRLTPDELAFYRKMNIPVPHLCPNCRHYARMRQRNPLKLWHRKCHCAGSQSENSVYKNLTSHLHGDSPCPNEFETSYAPERPEIVYCEQCYQAEVV